MDGCAHLAVHIGNVAQPLVRFGSTKSYALLLVRARAAVTMSARMQFYIRPEIVILTLLEPSKMQVHSNDASIAMSLLIDFDAKFSLGANRIR